MKLGLGHLCNYARYLLGRQPRVRYTPLTLFVVACSACNLQCPFCSYGLGSRHKAARLDSAMLTSARFRELLNHRLCRHLVTIGFTGGEPLLNPALL